MTSAARPQRRQRADPLPPGLQGVMANALRLHQSGRLQDAEAAYLEVLAQAPRNPDALHLAGVLAYQANQPELGATRIEAAIEADGLNAAFHDNLSLCYRALGRSEDALRACRRAIALDGRNPGTHFNLAAALVDLGRPQEARRALERAVKRDPNYAEAYNSLGNLLAKAGETDAAVAQYRKAIARRPNYIEAIGNLGKALAEAGRLEEALEQFAEASALDPENPQALADRANALGKAKRLPEALEAIRAALDIAPDRPEFQFLHATLLSESGDAKGAEEAYRRAAELAPEMAETHLNLGNLVAKEGRVEEALACFERYERAGGDRADALVAQTTSLIALGDRDRARALAEEAHRIAPQKTGPLVQLATLGHGNPDSLAAELERAYAATTEDEEAKRRAAFALANLHDRTGAWDQAFRWVEAANALARAARPYDTGADEQRLARIRAVFDRRFLDGLSAETGIDTDTPVFIVGMPRSGTTLIEQILASHPQVHGAGERAEIGRLSRNLQVILQSDTAYPDCVVDFTPDLAQQAARQYLDAVGRNAGEAMRITDKMPANFQHLGLIRMLFPKARVIHCRRDPMDTCLSCYFRYFAGAIDYVYDQESLGGYYRLYDTMMAHWRDVRPLAMFEVQYENVVADLDGEARKIVDFVGLDWDERCLRFHETKRTVQTASSQQVREPLYTTSVGRWRHYEAGLGRLREALGPLAP